ncbi:hypothetical protein [Streptomyces sp. PsTaAH-124]|uniref:hypothetical protein n=1 Tax=Streptomyces sp. PsTaAH-124 TaxID=1157638 RepID=UPI00131A46E6|nr:hypothetical protein [Streptomyces sp. PsTaAH-124]
MSLTVSGQGHVAVFAVLAVFEAGVVAGGPVDLFGDPVDVVGDDVAQVDGGVLTEAHRPVDRAPLRLRPALRPGLLPGVANRLPRLMLTVC